MSQANELPPAEQQPKASETTAKQPLKEKASQRPDPTFKRLTEKAVDFIHLNLKSNEFKTQQLSSPDLFLEIPSGTNIEGTLFDFCRQYSIIEFKSRNDPLTLPKFENQLARVHWWSKEHPKVGLENILNVIVSARYPRELVSYCKEKGVKFAKTQKGFYEGRCGIQDITIVVCEQLPITRKYAIWLLFADPTTQTWRETVRMLAREKLTDLLVEAMRLNPKEYKGMSTEIEEIAEREYTPEEEEAYRSLMKHYVRKYNLMPDFTPEERLKGLSPEEIIWAVPVEERLKGLPTEQLGDALSKLPPEELAKLLQRLQPPKQD